MRKITGKKSAKQALRVTRDSVFVGLDVHKRNAHIAVRINGQQKKTFVAPMDSQKIAEQLEPLRPGLRLVVYEAGPTGFGLVRHLRDLGFPAEVIDPCKMPRAAGQSSKSDGVDCRILAKLAEKGVLPFVTVPSEAEEGQRQVVRTREAIIRKLRRVKCQIKSFLLLHGIKDPHGLKNWTLAAIGTLEKLGLSEDLRFALDQLLGELRFFMQQEKKVTKLIKVKGRKPIRRTTVANLCTHPGVGELTAMIFLTEIFRPERFATKKQLACYLGLAPRVRQSGEIRREGPTIRAGQGTLRSKLVEASWSWIRHDPEAAKIYGRLCRNTGSGKKAVVAMARKMATNLWAMACKGETYCLAA